MIKPVIEIRKLSKKYRLGKKEPYYSLRDSLAGFFNNPLVKIRGFEVLHDGLTKDEFWALREISLKIMQGSAVGIIGLNGAGKTTLLKLISQITPPTGGEIILRGKVASLIEVGTGFHPELTGRENIYLNGAIMGMKRSEIKDKFSEIVEFSEIRQFLDTPVKRYSSGMYMRLAFAVAAHLDSDILLIDEVLAVGDAAFQKKCLGKIEDITGSGRTVLFVTHNIQIVSRYCQTAVLLEKGKLLKYGPVQQVVNHYLDYKKQTATVRKWQNLDNAPGDDAVRLREVRLYEGEVAARDSVDIRSELRIEITYEVLTGGISLVPSVQLSNQQGIIAFSSNDTELNWNRKLRKKGIYRSSAYIPGNFLSDGNYLLRVVIASFQPPMKHISEPELMTFYVADSGEDNSARGNYIGRIDGVVRPHLKWMTEILEKS